MEKTTTINVEGGNVRGGWIFFFKINKRDFTFIREMRVGYLYPNFQTHFPNPHCIVVLVQHQ